MSLTITTTTTRRARSLSLFATALRSSPPAILRLPVELLIEILETCYSLSKPSIFNLATSCKALCAVVDALVYRTVVLDTPKRIGLFNKTVKSKSPEFLRDNVKEIAITCEPMSYDFGTRVAQQLAQIIYSCGGLLKLAAPTPSELAYLPPQSTTNSSSLCEIVIDTFVQPTAPFLATSLLTSTTHLRVCEPSEGWVSPSSILSIFGPLPNLAYLHFARRAEANEDNDILFVDEIRSILAERSRLASLVVSIFPVEWRAKETARESHIWQTLSQLQMEDKRLILVIGGPGQWKAEYEVSAINARANFWDACIKNKAVC